MAYWAAREREDFRRVASSSKQYLHTASFWRSQSWVVAQPNYYRSGAMAGDSYSPSANPFDKELLSIRS
jgi:hypothetical protein